MIIRIFTALNTKIDKNESMKINIQLKKEKNWQSQKNRILKNRVNEWINIQISKLASWKKIDKLGPKLMKWKKEKPE